jgi:hypothetical protein
MRSKDGKFHSALVVLSEDFMTALIAATKLLAPNDEAKLGEFAEIPNEGIRQSNPRLATFAGVRSDSLRMDLFASPGRTCAR